MCPFKTSNQIRHAYLSVAYGNGFWRTLVVMGGDAIVVLKVVFLLIGCLR